MKFKCITCKIFKTLDSFAPMKEYIGINKNILIGPPECYLYSMCNKCYRRTRLLKGAEFRAKQRGFAFNLKLKDVIIPNYCPVLGIPLFHGVGKATDNSPTIDRVDNKKGYTSDNIIVISYRANRIKSDASLMELERISAFYNNLPEMENENKA